MKAVRLFALLLILVGVVASANAHSVALTTGLICGSSNDPMYCDQTTGEDIGCTEFCEATCIDFTNVTGHCIAHFGGYTCKCQGTPLP
jgi:hypothetical protein